MMRKFNEVVYLQGEGFRVIGTFEKGCDDDGDVPGTGAMINIETIHDDSDDFLLFHEEWDGDDRYWDYITKSKISELEEYLINKLSN